MNALLPIVLSLLLQPPVGPEDAFRANYAAVQAGVKYRLQAGDAPVESLNRLRS